MDTLADWQSDFHADDALSSIRTASRFNCAWMCPLSLLSFAATGRLECSAAFALKDGRDGRIVKEHTLPQFHGHVMDANAHAHALAYAPAHANALALEHGNHRWCWWGGSSTYQQTLLSCPTSVQSRLEGRRQNPREHDKAYLRPIACWSTTMTTALLPASRPTGGLARSRSRSRADVMMIIAVIVAVMHMAAMIDVASAIPCTNSTGDGCPDCCSLPNAKFAATNASFETRVDNFDACIDFCSSNAASFYDYHRSEEEDGGHQCRCFASCKSSQFKPKNSTAVFKSGVENTTDFFAGSVETCQKTCAVEISYFARETLQVRDKCPTCCYHNGFVAMGDTGSLLPLRNNETVFDCIQGCAETGDKFYKHTYQEMNATDGEPTFTQSCECIPTCGVGLVAVGWDYQFASGSKVITSGVIAACNVTPAAIANPTTSSPPPPAAPALANASKSATVHHLSHRGLQGAAILSLMSMIFAVYFQTA